MKRIDLWASRLLVWSGFLLGIVGMATKNDQLILWGIFALVMDMSPKGQR